MDSYIAQICYSRIHHIDKEKMIYLLKLVSLFIQLELEIIHLENH